MTMHGPRSLRARVATAAAVAIAIATLVLGGGVLALVGESLRSSVDDGLRARAAEIAALQATTPALLDAPGALDSAVAGRALLVEVVDGQGRLLHRSLALGGRVLPADDLVARAIATGRPALASRSAGGLDLRISVTPLAAVGGGPGAVVVAADVSDVNGNLADIRRVTAVAALLGVLAGVAAAWVLTRRAMRPLIRLTGAAEEISQSAAADERLPAPGTGDEVARLADTLNRMLGSLEAAREREQRFVADAAHELRTPITALLGNAAFIARHGADSAALGDIEADANRLSRTLDDLIALAREEGAGPPGGVVLLDEVARRAAAAGVVVTAPQTLRVRGDEAALERAIRNLVENAQLHGPAGGSVTVAVAERDGRALVTVTDEGPGLVGEAADRAFDRFWRGAEAGGRPGSGLGLAIVRSTAERHGGTARARGARFTIDLPAI
jgi:two-component system OmpR family sensor kinase